MINLNETSKNIIRNVALDLKCYKNISSIRRKKPEIWSILVKIIDNLADNNEVNIIVDLVKNLSELEKSEINQRLTQNIYLNEIIKTMNKHEKECKNFIDDLYLVG